jgi:glycine hydroxymethyltransferase
MKEEEMKQIAHFIGEVIDNAKDENKIAEVRKEVVELTKQFPIYN